MQNAAVREGSRQKRKKRETEREKKEKKGGRKTGI